MDAIDIESPVDQHFSYSVTCSFCGHNHWSIAPELFDLPAFNGTENAGNPDKTAKFALITCNECQITQFVNAKSIGIE